MGWGTGKKQGQNGAMVIKRMRNTDIEVNALHNLPNDLFSHHQNGKKIRFSVLIKCVAGAVCKQ